ncbi:MAG: baseplate J/gp47 family protein, partial [Solirubrobacteraceae bacterium]
TATVDSGGLTGGEDLESTTSWQARVLARIRTPPMGGAVSDYEAWAKAAMPGVAYVTPLANWGGLGNVGVAVAMTGPAVPTNEEITTIQDYIDPLAPVTANVVVLAASLNAVNVTLHLNPDSTAIRAAATAALALSFQQDATIGAMTYISRLSNAVSSADGEYSHELIAPAADVAAPSATAINTLGTVTFS